MRPPLHFTLHSLNQFTTPEISENAPDVVIEYTYSATTVSTERSTLSIVLRSANADGVGQALGNLGLRSVIPRDRAPFT
jgi:hypothetical protein